MSYGDNAQSDNLLSGIFDDIERAAQNVGKFAAKVGVVAGQADNIAEGRRKVAVIPTEGAYATVPVPGQMFGVSIPLVPMLLVGAVAVYLLARRK